MDGSQGTVGDGMGSQWKGAVLEAGGREGLQMGSDVGRAREWQAAD